MAGLLYKDFVAVKGKILVSIMFLATLFCMVCSVVVTSENFYIIIGFLLQCGLPVLPLAVPLALTDVLFGADIGKKKKGYLHSLPMDKKQYVASKYVFVLITYYVILSCVIIVATFMNTPVTEYLNATWFEILGGMMPLYICICLIISGLEMPFFVVMGVKAGNAVKTLILAIIFFMIMAYMLFGDLSVLERFDFEIILEYLETHPEISLAIQFGVPFTAGIVYYISYRISSALYVRKELQDEE